MTPDKANHKDVRAKSNEFCIEVAMAFATLVLPDPGLPVISRPCTVESVSKRIAFVEHSTYH